MKVSTFVAVASVFALSSAAWGQSASTVGSKATSGDSGTIGTAGSAAAGGTSASTIGLGAHSTGNSGSSSSIAGAGSAAADQGRVRSATRIHENPQMLQARSRATAQDGGTWSKSASNTRVKQSGDLSSRTKSMAHEPGSKPAMSKTRVR
jgi:hypothetical protein